MFCPSDIISLDDKYVIGLDDSNIIRADALRMANSHIKIAWAFRSRGFFYWRRRKPYHEENGNRRVCQGHCACECTAPIAEHLCDYPKQVYKTANNKQYVAV